MKINFTNNSFSFFLSFSILFHIILILCFIGSKSLPKLFKKDKTLLIEGAIRIDTIDLPDLPSKSKEKQKRKKSISIQKDKKAIEKKKKRKKENQIQKNKVEKEIHSKTKPYTKRKELNKGNKLSKGTREEGKSLTQQQLSEINLYVNQIDSQIRTQWNLPKYLTDKNLTAQVEVQINKQGQIIYNQILISSGNELFDGLVLKAIKNSAPYPAPPPNIQSFIKDGIVFKLSSKN